MKKWILVALMIYIVQFNDGTKIQIEADYMTNYETKAGQYTNFLDADGNIVAQTPMNNVRWIAEMTSYSEPIKPVTELRKEQVYARLDG